MKISVLSDIHIDFYTNPNKNKIQGQLERSLYGLLDDSEDVEVLIIAGDISHYNHQIKLLKVIAERWNYKKIFCVLGNHDFYLVSQSQKKKYENSVNRAQAWYDYEDPDGIVKILNGNIVEYKGVKFGGCASFYDGSFGVPISMYGETQIDKWNRTMNDARLIYGMGDMYEIASRENRKIKNILEADVIITHVCPVDNNIAFQDRYKDADTNLFYCFNGVDYVKETNAKYWVYGHSHGYHDFELFDTKFVMNALGYPNEFAGAKKTIIEV